MEDFSQNLEDVQEHLATGQFARPRFRQPLDLQKNTGVVFEVDDDEQDWDLFEDISEENYEEDTYALFQSYTPADMKMRVMESDGAAAISHFDATQQIAVNLEEMEKEMKNVNEEGTLKKLIVKPGNGMKVPERCRIYFHYMMMADGTCEPFDTSLIRKYPYCADLRQEAVLLPGLELAVRSMDLREASRFIVHPDLAYGVNGCPPRIPPNSKLLVIIETLQYIDEKRLSTPLYMSVEERNALPFASIFKVSNEMRTDGNGEYKEENYQFAIRKWRKGVQLLEDYPAADQTVCTQRNELLHTLYANLAQAYLRLEKPAQACSACKIGLKLVKGKDSCKLLYRFALAKRMLKDCDAALALVEQGLRIDKKHPQLKKLEAEILGIEASQKKALKKMWSGLFRTNKSNSGGTSKAQKTTDENTGYKSDCLPPSSSVATLTSDDNAVDDPAIFQKLNKMNINTETGNSGSISANIDFDEDVPTFAYCDMEFRRNNLKSCDAETNLCAVDSLPSVFFDVSELVEERVQSGYEKQEKFKMQEEVEPSDFGGENFQADQEKVKQKSEVKEDASQGKVEQQMSGVKEETETGNSIPKHVGKGHSDHKIGILDENKNPAE